MIKYNLKCNSCKNEFESWFGSSKEYEKLKKKNFLKCHSCNSIKIEKTLMSPQLINKVQDKYKDTRDVKLKVIKEKIKKYQKFIKENFDYVGDNFAYEARSIHYNSKKPTKGIYGKATPEETSELLEEGIEVLQKAVDAAVDDPRFLEATEKLISGVRSFITDDVHPKNFIEAHQGSYVEFFNHHAEKTAADGWIAEAAARRRRSCIATAFDTSRRRRGTGERRGAQPSGVGGGRVAHDTSSPLAIQRRSR